jgi:hypothetical protein
VPIRKLQLILFVLLLPLCAAKAQPGDSLIIHFKNGTSATVDLHSIRKITFDTLGLSVPTTHRSSSLELLPSFPNPSAKVITIPLIVASSGKISITIYNKEGKIIRLLQKIGVSQGKNIVQWDGLDQSGRPVASGEYLYEVAFNTEVEVRKVLIVK